MAALPTRYWDSDCFLGWLRKEDDKYDLCRPVIRAAEKSQLRIVTSALTLTEVVKMKKSTPIPADQADIIRDFFKHEWIIVRQLDRFIAEYARNLVWSHKLDPKDSVHVATALKARCPRMDTFDAKLIKRSNKLGDPPLEIGRPDLVEQLAFIQDDDSYPPEPEVGFDE